MTVDGKSASTSPLQIQQLSKFYNDSKQVTAFRLTFGDYKHNYNQPPFSLTISRQTGPFPVQLMLYYFRGHNPGPLFQSSAGEAVPRGIFSVLLSSVINFCGLNPFCYKGHSFCMLQDRGHMTHKSV
jgi:hypothetical protein